MHALIKFLTLAEADPSSGKYVDPSLIATLVDIPGRLPTLYVSNPRSSALRGHSATNYSSSVGREIADLRLASIPRTLDSSRDLSMDRAYLGG